MIEPLAVASDGYLCGSGFTLSVVSNGYLCTVEITPTTTLPPTTTIPPVDRPKPPFIGFGGGGISYFFSPKKMWKEVEPTGDTEVRIITVKVIKDGKEFIQKAYTRDLDVKVEDVQFDVIEEKNDVKIKIRLKN